MEEEYEFRGSRERIAKRRGGKWKAKRETKPRE